MKSVSLNVLHDINRLTKSFPVKAIDCFIKLMCDLSSRFKLKISGIVCYAETDDLRICSAKGESIPAMTEAMWGNLPLIHAANEILYYNKDLPDWHSTDDGSIIRVYSSSNMSIIVAECTLEDDNSQYIRCILRQTLS